ncbi:MAG: polyprenyl synthetase family protein, partial [Bacteroidales bacterium]|nr:polyprenyl synthetase family protein [Bacteroidales bacterium]
AFQLQDDLLDVYANQDKFGKKIGGDILTNKKTFLLIKALELAKDKTAEKLNSILKKNDFVPEEKIKEVTAIYNSLNLKELTTKMIDSYHEKSLTYLELLSVNDEKKKVLRDFAASIMKRDF